MDALANWHQSLRSVSALNFHLRGSRQRSWMPGLAKPDQGGKQEANGGKLAFIRAVQAFTCPADNQSHTQFNTSSFYVTHRFFVTFFTEESNVPLVPFVFRVITSSGPDGPARWGSGSIPCGIPC